MRNVVGVAILVVWSGASPACVRPPPAVPPSGERGGASGAGGTPIPEECRSHDVDIAAATLAGALTIGGVPADADPNARLVPGTYDLFFSNAGSGGDTRP